MALAREDLKNFQARVAERLKVAREQEVGASWLAVAIDGMNCLLPLSHANEVMPVSPILPVPYVKTWFYGAINARGRIYGVVDLATYLAVEAKQSIPNRDKAWSIADCSLVGLNADLSMNCVLLVNKVMGLRNISSFDQSLPSKENAPNYFGTRYQDSAGATWQEVNLQHLARSTGFLSISV